MDLKGYAEKTAKKDFKTNNVSEFYGLQTQIFYFKKLSELYREENKRLKERKKQKTFYEHLKNIQQ